MGITHPTMEKTLSSQATNWREGRRLRALELKERGWKQSEIAEALGVSEGAVSQWMKRAREEGAQALRHKPPPGAPSRLSNEQRARLPELLAQGAEAHGFRGQVWTCERVAVLIRRQFGASYHPAHVSGGLSSGTRKPSNTGRKRSGLPSKWLPSKGGAKGRQNHSVCRSVGLLLATHGSLHLRSDRKDAHPQGEPHTRSPFGDEWHHARRQALHDRAGASLQG